MLFSSDWLRQRLLYSYCDYGNVYSGAYKLKYDEILSDITDLTCYSNNNESMLCCHSCLYEEGFVVLSPKGIIS